MLARRAIFQLHVWVGVATGLYIVVVCSTGAALVFRIDLQRALYQRLFTPKSSGPPAHPADIMDSVQRAFPGDRVSGVDAPTTGRPTYLAYSRDGNPYLVAGLSCRTEHACGLQSAVEARDLGAAQRVGFWSVLFIAMWTVTGFRNFAGTGVRVAWVILGLAPPLLFASGFTMWWTRVARPRWRVARDRPPRRGASQRAGAISASRDE